MPMFKGLLNGLKKVNPASFLVEASYRLKYIDQQQCIQYEVLWFNNFLIISILPYNTFYWLLMLSFGW